MLELRKAPFVIKGTVNLPPSKSLANRLLILEAITGTTLLQTESSYAEDIQLLRDALTLTRQTNKATIDIHHAGTAMRFLTAYLSCIEGEWTLTGSSRMKERPIAPLVESLRELGAQIDYLGEEGYPPLQITGKKITKNSVSINGSLSSQFISALLLAAPSMQNGLELQLSGKTVSEPYIAMTISLMTACGISVAKKGNTISVQPGLPQIPPNFKIESDWSAASYYYSICALSPGAEIILFGLNKNSDQADAVIPKMFAPLGVITEFSEGGIHIKNTPRIAHEFSADFSSYPDIAQTLAVTCFALGIPAKLSGLSTLKVKETDRIVALKNELEKFGASVIIGLDFLEITNNKPECDSYRIVNPKPEINTYNDHRMAMSFAPLALCLPSLNIKDEKVVAKSYPGFWEDLISLGFSVNLQPQ